MGGAQADPANPAVSQAQRELNELRQRQAERKGGKLQVGCADHSACVGYGFAGAERGRYGLHAGRRAGGGARQPRPAAAGGSVPAQGGGKTEKCQFITENCQFLTENCRLLVGGRVGSVLVSVHSETLGHRPQVSPDIAFHMGALIPNVWENQPNVWENQPNVWENQMLTFASCRSYTSAQGAVRSLDFVEMRDVGERATLPWFLHTLAL